MAKQVNGGKKKVSRKKKATQKWKWLKEIYAELDLVKKRLDAIEEFLEGFDGWTKT